MRALIVGCGYLGRSVAASWRAGGHAVSALTRSPARAAELRTLGVIPILGDVLEPDVGVRLPVCDVLLYAVGYDRAAGQDKRRVYVDGLRHVLAAVAGRVGRFVYISSSSVYGQDRGEWVDETSPTEPQAEGGRICRDAERTLCDSPLAAVGGAVTLRLSGLYGPARLLAKVDALRAGTPLPGSPKAWLNLIHRDDAATAVIAAATHPAPDPLYLVSDDRPVTRGEYYGELARLIGAPPPVFDDSHLPRHGTGLNKRCRNRRVKQSLGVTWCYPTWSQGLSGSLEFAAADHVSPNAP